MFSLHETTQRRVCRVIFVTCAVLPALATLACVTYAVRPWRAADWQRFLAQELHIRATIEHVASPRPGVTRLTGVQLADLRSERQLVGFEQVEVRSHDSQVILSTAEMRIEATELPAVAAAIATWLANDDMPGVELQIGQLKLVGSRQQVLTLGDSRVQSGAGAGQSTRLGIQSGALRLLVDRRDRLVAMLETKQGSLPCWLLTDLFPSLGDCTHATFNGSLRLESDSPGLAGALRGRFDNVALAQWIGPHEPHLVQGEAQVEFDELLWHGARVLSAKGRLRASDGAVGRSLLVALKEQLYCSIVLEPSLADIAPFDELACGFELNEAGVSVDGQCQGSNRVSGCLIAANGRPVLLEPIYANLPVAQLVQILSRPAASWLPASVEAHEMAGKLPLPSSTSKR